MIWLIGCNGMLGTELSIILEKSGLSFIATDREIDITDPLALDTFIKNKPVKWIINCAAYTAVDKAEDDAETCRRLNTFGAANIASCAGNIDARLLHISTDYVFDGKGIYENNTDTPRPYREDDTTNPVSVYGLSKRDGELAAMENNHNSYIIRTAWLYGKYGNNFAATMLRLMNQREEISVIDDQRGSPTWAFDLASLILIFIEYIDSGNTIPPGIFHYTNEGNISWFDFANEIYRQGAELGLIKKKCAIIPCTTAEYPSKAQRPVFSVLDKSKIKAALDISIPDWDKSLREYLKNCAL